MQDQKRVIRPWVAFASILIVLACLAVLREVELTGQIQTLRLEKQGLLTQQEELKTRVQEAESSVVRFKSRHASQAIESSSEPQSPKAQVTIAALQAQVKDLRSALQRRRSGPLVPEYDPTNPQSQIFQPDSPEPQTNSVPMRSWGMEQALGAPNTERAGDLPTAWASREPDAGPEWLAVGFDHAVDVAEIRVRETFNPGAISKVTALENGREVLLWEGTAAGGVAPRDFVIPLSGNVRADSVVIHLDTARVPGWNEIDAVELVGRDGSRQWATAANASSTYAESLQPNNQPVSRTNP